MYEKKRLARALQALQANDLHKPSKVGTSKTLFSGEYVIGATCLDKCFSFHVITERHCL